MNNGTSQRTAVRDPFFGELTWDPGTDSYVSSITVSTLGTIQVSIRIEHDDPFLTLKDIKGAQEALSIILVNESRYRTTIAAALLERVRQIGSGGGEIGIETFLSRMKLEAVSFFADDTALWYADGGLFGGQTIYATVDSTWKLREIDVVR